MLFRWLWKSYAKLKEGVNKGTRVNYMIGWFENFGKRGSVKLRVYQDILYSLLQLNVDKWSLYRKIISNVKIKSFFIVLIVFYFPQCISFRYSQIISLEKCVSNFPRNVMRNQISMTINYYLRIKESFLTDTKYSN